MLKKILDSSKESIIEKTKNPFLGTYLIVWLIRNWDLVYTLFNFDKGTTLGEKVGFVELYYNDISFLKNLVYNILWALLLLLCTYIILSI